MKTIRIHTFTIAALFFIPTLPWIGYVAAIYAQTHALRIGGNPPPNPAAAMAAAFAGLLLALAVIGVAMRKSMHRPLGGLSAAARQIADGDWDIRLPASRISEIAEVRDGFQAMAARLRQAGRRQAEMEEERRFLISAVAHDLRTPLFALRGYLDGLEQDIAQSPEQRARYLAVCKDKAAQLDRLVEDLFTFTKMEVAEAELNKREIDLLRLVQHALDSLGPQIQQKRIRVSADFAADPITVAGDPHLLERALCNLLDNAVRHTPADGTIVVRCVQNARRIDFEIRDTGPGFAEDELPRAFDPLYRGEASRSRATGGAGLGLAIAQRIIRRHGGELSAANAPAQGAVLSGWLPAAPMPADPTQSPESRRIPNKA